MVSDLDKILKVRKMVLFKCDGSSEPFHILSLK